MQLLPPGCSRRGLYDLICKHFVSLDSFGRQTRETRVAKNAIKGLGSTCFWAFSSPSCEKRLLDKERLGAQEELDDLLEYNVAGVINGVCTRLLSKCIFEGRNYCFICLTEDFFDYVTKGTLDVVKRENVVNRTKEIFKDTLLYGHRGFEGSKREGFLFKNDSVFSKLRGIAMNFYEATPTPHSDKSPENLVLQIDGGERLTINLVRK